ncbi:magnesium transporter CorA [bacterium]|nr:magnesium transporter CorA [bacterium]
MHCYLIKDTLQECSIDDILQKNGPYAAVLSEEEWKREREHFDVGIDIEPCLIDILVSEANVNYDSITGTFCLPDRTQPDRDDKFAFVLDEKGVVFIDNSSTALRLVQAIQIGKRWGLPSLERFLYDFLDQLISGDIRRLENSERELRRMEAEIIKSGQMIESERIIELRNNIQTLREHYEQLEDIAQVFDDNENEFFKEENLRYFRMFLNRLSRLLEKSAGLQVYTASVRDLYNTQLDIRQNRIMSVLTVITTVFFPLTLITGWYGMNFANMPELTYEYGYPIVIAVSLGIILLSIIFFKNKKWF